MGYEYFKRYFNDMTLDVRSKFAQVYEVEAISAALEGAKLQWDALSPVIQQSAAGTALKARIEAANAKIDQLRRSVLAGAKPVASPRWRAADWQRSD